MNYILITLFRFLSYLPFIILKVIAFKLYIINMLIFRYRYQVVLENLLLVFPSKPINELYVIRNQFFRGFFNIIIEIIKMISASKSFINHRVTITNKELIDQYINNHQSIVLIGGHYNNWEWIGQKLAISTNQKVVVIFKSLNNKFFNGLLKKVREKFGVIAISMEESMRYIIKSNNDCKIIGVVADQNPVVNSKTEWTLFFNREVPVFMGIEKIAKKMNYPVVFCDMQKNKNGHYYITFELLESNPRNTKDGEITKRYFNRLEKQIIEEPSAWLWSHRRWKHKR